MDNKIENTYSTKDLAEASFLLAKGKPLIRIDRDGKICWFIFSDIQECEKLSTSFWFGDSTINAKSFYEAMVTLKNRIFSIK